MKKNTRTVNWLEAVSLGLALVIGVC